MTIAEFREAVRARPFRPFRVHLADGRSLRVIHPEFVALSPTGRSAIVYLRNGGFQVVDLFLVTGLAYAKSRQKRRRA